MLLRKLKKGIRNPVKGFRYVREQLSRPYLSSSLALSSRFDLGHHIFKDDWDTIILLDTCRVDALKEVASEYKFINSVSARWSVGSTSPEWIANTFDAEY
jgi:hypothetical protein